MAFWSSEKFRATLLEVKIIEPYDETAVKYGAYELSLGSEAFLTSYDDNKKKTLADGEQVVIPPGQFGLLLTEEKVSVPDNAIGFISIKAGIKFKGLVNVSGFHVDPGFSGKLKFSVYNAGSRDIVLQRKRRVFLLWFSDLDQPTQPYSGEHAYQSEITPEDVMQIAGKIASPGQLKNDIRDLANQFEKQIHTLEHELEKKVQGLDHRVDMINWKLTALLSIATGLLAFSLRGCFPASEPHTTIKPTLTQPVQTTNNVNGPPLAPIK
jgi:dCTP deaminase